MLWYSIDANTSPFFQLLFQIFPKFLLHFDIILPFFLLINLRINLRIIYDFLWYGLNIGFLFRGIILNIIRPAIITKGNFGYIAIPNYMRL